MICKECGANIPDGFEYCMKCGAKADALQKEISTQDRVGERETVKIIGNKKRPIIIGAIVVVVIVVAVALGNNFLGVEKTFFEDIPWGTDAETVKARIEEEFELFKPIPDYDEAERTITTMFGNFEEMEGVGALCSFDFNYDNKLQSVDLFASLTDESFYTKAGMVDEIVRKYDERYGDSDFRAGFMDTYTWENEDTTVVLTCITEGLLHIKYSSNK